MASPLDFQLLFGNVSIADGEPLSQFCVEVSSWFSIDALWLSSDFEMAPRRARMLAHQHNGVEYPDPDGLKHRSLGKAAADGNEAGDRRLT